MPTRHFVSVLIRFLAALVRKAISLTGAHESHEVFDGWKYEDELIRARIVHCSAASMIPYVKQLCGSGKVTHRVSWDLIGYRHDGDVFQRELRACL